MEDSKKSYAVVSAPQEVATLLNARKLIEVADSYRPMDADQSVKDAAHALCEKHQADGWLVSSHDGYRKLRLVRKGEGVVVGEQLTNGTTVASYIGRLVGGVWQIYYGQGDE